MCGFYNTFCTFFCSFSCRRKKKIVENNCSRLVCKTNVEFFGHIFSRVLTQFFFFFSSSKKKKQKNNGIPYFFSFLFLSQSKQAERRRKKKNVTRDLQTKNQTNVEKKQKQPHLLCFFLGNLCVRKVIFFWFLRVTSQKQNKKKSAETNFCFFSNNS